MLLSAQRRAPFFSCLHRLVLGIVLILGITVFAVDLGGRHRLPAAVDHGSSGLLDDLQAFF
jgi:hypothetical protein